MAAVASVVEIPDVQKAYVQQETWKCNACGCVSNPSAVATCGACGTARMQVAPQPQAVTAIPPTQTFHQKTTSCNAVASMVLGIVGIVIGFGLGLILGPIAIFLGMKAKKEINENPTQMEGKGMAIAGIVTGIVATAFGVILLIWFLFVFTAFSMGGP